MTTSTIVGVRLTIGASLIVLLAGGSLLGFLELAQVGIVPTGEVAVLLTVARLALVGLAVWSAVAVVSTAREADDPPRELAVGE